jgi:hypothetical protein
MNVNCFAKSAIPGVEEAFDGKHGGKAPHHEW